MSSPVGPVTSAPPVVQVPQKPAAVEGKFAQRLAELQQTPVVHFLKDMEAGQASLDALVKAATSGKHFSNVELLALQASMYQYTLTIDLVSKVVQQAVSGLKDLLKMQV